MSVVFVKQEETPNEHVLFVGASGVGKSTLLNAILGRIQFESGVSIGARCKTTKCQTILQDRVCYVDTSGDIEQRAETVQIIKSALKDGGRIKLFFVVTVEAGRVRPQDVSTVSSILVALHGVSFGLLINKASKALMCKDSSETLSKINESFTLESGHKPQHSLMVGEDKAAQDAENVLINGENIEALRRFIESFTPYSNTLQTDVDSIATDLEKLKLENNRLLEEQKRERERQEQQLHMQRLQLEQMRKQEELERQRQREEQERLELIRKLELVKMQARQQQQSVSSARSGCDCRGKCATVKCPCRKGDSWCATRRCGCDADDCSNRRGR